MLGSGIFQNSQATYCDQVDGIVRVASQRTTERSSWKHLLAMCQFVGGHMQLDAP